MRPSKRNLLSCGFLLFALLLTSCIGGFPPALERDIRAENDRLQAAQQRFEYAQAQLRHEEAAASDLFQNGSAPAQWKTTLRNAGEKLDRAQEDSRELAHLTHQNRPEVQAQARRLLAGERALREAAMHDAETVEATVAHWLEFRRDVPSSLDRMRREYAAIGAVDLAPVAATIARAEQDWPAKKSALDARLADLRDIPKNAETEWLKTEPARQDAAAGKANGAELATLIEEDDALAKEQKTLEAAPAAMTALTAQLYNSWDKILTDLDAGNRDDPFYRERIKTIRTHYTDVAAKKTETDSDEHWVNVSEPAFDVVEGDLGMAIAHKDAGLFDSEAQTTPEPAGFAYVASPAQGSNQYGYWSHSGGESVWTFLPQYLILRELLWNHDYRPIPTFEYDGYRTAQRAGTTYYGRETPTSPPKYGSHGTFTQTHYADSRYVQSGGFKGSAYASRGSSSMFGGAHTEEHRGSLSSENGAGHRFGRAPGSTPAGQRFGRARSFSPGRSFGRRR